MGKDLPGYHGQGGLVTWHRACLGSGTDNNRAQTRGHHNHRSTHCWGQGSQLWGQEHTQSPGKGRGAHSVPASPRPSTSPLASAPQGSRELGQIPGQGKD